MFAVDEHADEIMLSTRCASVVVPTNVYDELPINATTGHSEQGYVKLCKRLTALQLLFQLKCTDIDPAIINECGASAYKLDYEEKE